MRIYEVLTVALVVVLAAAATAAIYYGLLGMIGSFFIVLRNRGARLTSRPVAATTTVNSSGDRLQTRYQRSGSRGISHRSTRRK